MKTTTTKAVLLFLLLPVLAPPCSALTNPSFEAPYNTLSASPTITGQVANGWADNSAWSSSTMTYSNDTTVSHTGASSQKITLASNTTAQFIQPLTLTLGRTYAARVWMRASSPTTVSFQLRQSGSPYATYLSANVALTTDWQQVTISGPVPGSGTMASILMIQLTTPATIWIDDASLDDITPSASVVNNGGFEGTYHAVGTTGNATGQVANGWADNSTFSGAVVAYSADTSNVHGGATAQKISYTSGGSPVQFVQSVNLTRGRIYNASVWLKAAAPTSVYVAIRQTGGSYTGYLSTVPAITIGTGWTQVNLAGTVGDGACIFLIQLSTPATIWVDDAALVDATPPLPQNAVSNEFFGMHFSLGSTNPSPALPWPTNYVGLWRLWDAGVTWNALQPNLSNQGSDPANWNQSVVTLLDGYVQAAQAHSTALILTLGQTPDWATSNPTKGSYGNRGCNYPDNIQTWRDYVTGLGNRYKGKIHYWEIWNEPNSTGFYTGTIQQMVTLTQEAETILKAIDPSNQIISPSATGDPSNFLSAFLAAGGAAYCDIIGYHLYVDPSGPEQQVVRFGAVRQATMLAGVYKPIWNTEQGWYSGVPDAATSVAYVARCVLLNWAYGMEGRFAWYRWEADTNPNDTAAISLTTTARNNTLTPAGAAHRIVGNWLRGGVVMTSVTCDSNNTWHIVINRPFAASAYSGHILWNPDMTITNYTVPQAWGATIKQTLDGTITNFTGSAVPVGPAPILLENRTP